MKILVTGANGFIGSALIDYYSNMPEIEVVGLVRKLERDSSNNVEFRRWDIGLPAKKLPNLSDIDVIIHTAGRAHIMNDSSNDPLKEFRKVNTHGTLHLATLAAANGVSRFIFLSSIKASGENTKVGIPFSRNNLGKPIDAYGLSKYEAEVGLMKISQASGLEITIVRPPMVYGTGVKGNFNTLVKILSMRVPLPLGSIVDNRRSMVGIDNLVSMLGVCVKHPNAANKLFFVSDNNDLSTISLLTLLGSALEVPAITFRFPVVALCLIAKLFGAKLITQRIIGNLQVDISATLNELQWVPPYTVEENFQKIKKIK